MAEYRAEKKKSLMVASLHGPLSSVFPSPLVCSHFRVNACLPGLPVALHLAVLGGLYRVPWGAVSLHCLWCTGCRDGALSCPLGADPPDGRPGLEPASTPCLPGQSWVQARPGSQGRAGGQNPTPPTPVSMSPAAALRWCPNPAILPGEDQSAITSSVCL